jgi:hypothetical protein
MDEGSLLVYPELILKGQLPYRDFETFYGPANLWVLAAAYAGFGPSIFAERAVGLTYRVLTLMAIFALVQRWGTTLAAGCTIVASLLLLPILLGAYAWIGGATCALWSIWTIAKPESTRRCFLGGILAGLALLFRIDLGPAVIASALPLFLLMRAARRWSYLGGAAFALLPLGMANSGRGSKGDPKQPAAFPGDLFKSGTPSTNLFSGELLGLAIFCSRRRRCWQHLCRCRRDPH